MSYMILKYKELNISQTYIQTNAPKKPKSLGLGLGFQFFGHLKFILKSMSENKKKKFYLKFSYSTGK